MRILFHWPTQNRDGAQADTAALINALAGADHQLRVVGGGLGLLNMAAMVVPPAAAGWTDDTADWIALARLRRAWLAFAPDLIFVRAAAFHGAAGRLAKATRSSLYVSANARLTPIYDGLTPRLRARGKAAETATWRAADRVLVPSASLGEVIHTDGVPREKLTVMRPAMVVPPMVARAAPREVVRIGVQAGDVANPTVAAVTAGLTQLGEGIRAELVRLPEHADATVWAGVDIALLPRGGDYFVPPALLAAMAAGCAIVAADDALARETVKHAQTAVLFDAASPLYAWNAVRWLLDEPQLRELLGQAARRSLEQSARGWDGVAAEITALAEADIAYRRSFAASRLA